MARTPDEVSRPTSAGAASPKPPKTAAWLRGRGRYPLQLAIIVAAAALLRVAFMDRQSLTMDEVKDLGMARGGWAAINATENRFPPLYHTLLSAWLAVFPEDVTGRRFSVLCSTLTVAVIGELGRVLGNRRAGLWSATIAAVSPFAVWHGVEVRVYTLYLFLGAAAIWQFTIAWMEDRPRPWIAFALAAVAGVYTHYYMGLLIACAAACWLGVEPFVSAKYGGKKNALVPRNRKSGLVAFAAIGVACIPAVLMLRGDLDQAWGYAQTSRFSAPALGYAYFSLLSGYTLGPGVGELHELAPRQAMLAALPWALTLGAATLLLLASWVRDEPPDQRISKMLWFAIFCLTPPLAVGLVSRAAGFGYSPRHAAWSFAPLAAALGSGIAFGRRRTVVIVAGATLFAGFAVALSHRYTEDRYANEDARRAAALIERQSGDKRLPVFALSGYMRDPLEFYLPAGWPVVWLPDIAFPENEKPVIEQAIAAIRDETSPGEEFWLAYSRAFHGDPEGAIFDAIAAAFTLQAEREVPGIRLYRGRRP